MVERTHNPKIRIGMYWHKGYFELIFFCKTLDTGESGGRKKRSYSLVRKTSTCKGFLLTVPEREGLLQSLLLHNHTTVPLWNRNQLQLSKFQEEAAKRENSNNNNCLETTKPKIAGDLTSSRP